MKIIEKINYENFKKKHLFSNSIFKYNKGKVSNFLYDF